MANENDKKLTYEEEVLTSENLLFMIEAEKAIINNDEEKDNEDNLSINKTENNQISINLNALSNKNNTIEEDLIDDDEDDKESNEDNEKEKSKKVKKVKKVITEDKSSFKSKIKKILPFIGLGFLVFILLITLVVIFGESAPSKISTENVPSPSISESTYKDEPVVQEKKENVSEVVPESSESLEKRRELYKREELRKANENNPLPELDNTSSKKNEPTVKVVKDNTGFKASENKQNEKNFVVLNENKPDDAMLNPIKEDVPITTSSTVNVNQTQNEVYEEELRKAEIEKENLRAENLRLEQEKSEREKELERKLAEIQLIKKEQALKETLTYKAKTKDVAINVFLINSNMAFLGGNLYVEPTVSVNKKVYTASFNDIEGKYYNIEGTTNYISVKQLEDNYILESE